MTKPHPVAADQRLNPVLAAEVAGLRGGMLEAAERAPAPERFEFDVQDDRPAVVIRDRETGRTATIPLGAYAYTRRALADLFG